MARLAKADLELGERRGAGSQGAIFAVHRVRTATFPFPVVYKEFNPATTTVSGAALEALTTLRDRLDDEDRRALDAFTAWPAAAVTDDRGQVCGYLMQELPDRFFQTISVTGGGTQRIVREVQHLFVRDELTRRNLGEVPVWTERLAVCRAVAFAFGFLHAKQLVYGDLSYRNAVYTLRPAPAIVLLDCDGVRVKGQGSAVPQLNSPGWEPPERGAQTIQTDRFKLGLFVLRCVSPHVNSQVRDPGKAAGALDAEGMVLLRRALSQQPEERTSGREWVEYFDARIAAGGGVPARSGAAPPPPPAARIAPPPAFGGTAVRSAAVVASAGPHRLGTAGRRPAAAAGPRPAGVVGPAVGATAHSGAWSSPAAPPAARWRPLPAPTPAGPGGASSATVVAAIAVIAVAALLAAILVTALASDGASEVADPSPLVTRPPAAASLNRALATDAAALRDDHVPVLIEGDWTGAEGAPERWTIRYAPSGAPTPSGSVPDVDVVHTAGQGRTETETSRPRPGAPAPPSEGWSADVALAAVLDQLAARDRAEPDGDTPGTEPAAEPQVRAAFSCPWPDAVADLCGWAVTVTQPDGSTERFWGEGGVLTRRAPPSWAQSS